VRFRLHLTFDAALYKCRIANLVGADNDRKTDHEYNTAHLALWPTATLTEINDDDDNGQDADADERVGCWSGLAIYSNVARDNIAERLYRCHSDDDVIAVTVDIGVVSSSHQ